MCDVRPPGALVSVTYLHFFIPVQEFLLFSAFQDQHEFYLSTRYSYNSNYERLLTICYNARSQENRIRGTGGKETRENLERHISWRL